VSLTNTLTRTGLGYIFTVEDSMQPGIELLRFEISNVASNTWGINGRVTVRSTITTARSVPGKAGYVTTERLDFLSGQSRRYFAERLRDLIPAPPGGAAIDWPVLVEEMVAGVMDAESRQPIVRDLSEVAAVSHTPHLYPYLLPERKATILYGAGGTGKSAIAAAIAAAVQTGCKFLGQQAQQRNVLYLDWETDEGDVAYRIAAASRGLGLTSPAPVKYMALELPLQYEMTHIAAAVVENDIGLVILDSVGMASTQGKDGADPASEAIAFFRALRILQATVLCIDHISGEDQRRGRAGASKPYGSIFKWNTARNAFELIEAGEGQVILRHRKANLGPKMPGGEVMLSVVWDDVQQSVRYRRIDTTAPRKSLGVRIIEVLSTGPSTYRGLVDILNTDQEYDLIGEAELRIASRELLADGVVSIDNSGTLRYTPHQPEVDNPDAPTVPLDLKDQDVVDS
jgi:hypothetical protein